MPACRRRATRPALENLDNPLIRLYRRSRAEGFGPEVKRRIMLGTYALSAGYYDAYYKKALQVRRLIRQDFDRAFEEVDLLIGPVTPTPAFKIGEKIDDPLAMYLFDLYTVSTNLAGIGAFRSPAASVPPGCRSACTSRPRRSKKSDCSAGPTCSSRPRIGIERKPGLR